MLFSLVPMVGPYAEQIIAWRYAAPYDIYNPTGGEEGLAELLNGDYLAALNEAGQLVGFCCYGASARVPAGQPAGCYADAALDMGLGLRPDLTGCGLGASFLQAVEDRAAKAGDAHGLRLTVLQFNQRAIKVYQSSGFVVSGQFAVAGVDGERTFWVMTKQRSTACPAEKTFAS